MPFPQDQGRLNRIPQYGGRANRSADACHRTGKFVTLPVPQKATPQQATPGHTGPRGEAPGQGRAGGGGRGKSGNKWFSQEGMGEAGQTGLGCAGLNNLSESSGTRGCPSCRAPGPGGD